MTIEVTMKKRDPVTVASLSMQGPFSLMGEAFGRLFGWIGGNGYVPAGPPVGVYYNDPHQVAAEELLWEIYCPIGGDVSPSGPDEQGLSVKTIETYRQRIKNKLSLTSAAELVHRAHVWARVAAGGEGLG